MSYSNRGLLVLAVGAACAALAACSEELGTGPDGPTVAAVEVSPELDTLTALGSTTQFQAVARTADGETIPGKSFTWTSSASGVAEVARSSGLATALANGTAAISATTDDVSGSATLVVDQTVASLEVVAPVDTLKALGATALLTATAKDSRDNPVPDKSPAWSSSDESVARVDEDGLVTAVANGSVTITATVDDVSGWVDLIVKQTGSALILTVGPAGAAAGEPFATQPALEIRDAAGNRVDNDNSTVVTATISSGGGTLLGTPARTASGGVVTYTDLAIGGIVGDRTLRFTAADLPTATSSVFYLDTGPAAQLLMTGGDGQTGLAATTLPVPFEVKVADAYDNAVSEVDVDWAVTVGSGSPSSSQVPTDAAGMAAITYTLGRYAGTETIEASVTGLSGSPAAFDATATPNGTISGTISLSNGFMASAGLVAKSAQPDAVRVAPLRRAAPGHKPLGSRARETAPAVGSPAARRQARARYTPDELIVVFRPGAVGAPPVGSAALAAPATVESVGHAIRAGLAPHAGAGRAEITGVSPAILAARLQVVDPGWLDDVAAQLRRDPGVASVERNAVIYLDAGARANPAAGEPLSPPPPPTLLPNDPWYPAQAWHYAMVDAPEAWDITTGSSGVLVAVVDDGIRFDHPQLTANLTGDGYDFATNSFSYDLCAGGTIGHAGDGDGYDPDPTNPADYTYDAVSDCLDQLRSSGNHGLHVAGTIGAVGNDAAKLTGLNWSVSIRPVRVCGLVGCTHYDMAQGVLYAAGLAADDGAGGTVQAAAGASVINMSLGGSVTSTVLENAVISASGAGALIVASAGNEGTADPRYPAAYPQTLSVSAVGPDAVLASYSSYGSTVDIAAPGGDLADGDWTFGVFSTTWDFTLAAPNYDAWHGTSMAAPHVSGVAALLLAYDGGLTAADLKARLTGYAVDVGAPGRDDLYGAGIVNAWNSLTQSFGPPRALYARLYDGQGGIVATTLAQPDGSYAFTELPDAYYRVYAGQDESGDGTIGVPGRRWGAYGGTAVPSSVQVDGAGTYPASFTVGFPAELEPNGEAAQADALPVGGYIVGVIGAPSTDADFMRVRIPAVGQYTFETFALDGACGFALDEDTILELFDSLGSSLAWNDDIDVDNNNYCSRITVSLSPGTYHLAVTGYWSGRYQLQARAGG